MRRKVYKRLIYKELGHLPRQGPFVFGIGLSRTGTTTLNDALGELGYRSYHLPPVTRIDAASGEIGLA